MSDFIDLPVVVTDSVFAVPTVLDLPPDSVAGAVLFVQDVGTLYLYNGTSWNAIPMGSTDQRLRNTQTLTSSSAPLVDIPNLAATVVSGRTYQFEYTFLYSASTTGTGIAINIGLTNSAAGTLAGETVIPTSIIASTLVNYSAATTATSTSSTAANTIYAATSKGVLICSASGTLQPRFSRGGAATSSILPGSVGIIREFT